MIPLPAKHPCGCLAERQAERAQRESNPQPFGPKPNALSSWAMGADFENFYLEKSTALSRVAINFFLEQRGMGAKFKFNPKKRQTIPLFIIPEKKIFSTILDQNSFG